MAKLSLLAVAALAPVATNAFAPVAPITQLSVNNAAFQPLFAEVEDKSESVFVPPAAEEVDEDAVFAKTESLGRGSAKVSISNS
jgi:hypothetical protein